MQSVSDARVVSVNAGARLDRLPICGFHWRILALIGARHVPRRLRHLSRRRRARSRTKGGMSTIELNAAFVTATFIGMTFGAWFSGILGDRYGRRFSYQVNLAIFGLASLAAALAPSMQALIAARFVIGIGLGLKLSSATQRSPNSSRRPRADDGSAFWPSSPTSLCSSPRWSASGSSRPLAGATCLASSACWR
jgi:MFS transporter, putative metabolite:H+ symporter